MACPGRPALASFLVLAGCAQSAPPPAGSAKAAGWGAADVCAIAARPETPGHHETGDPAAGAKADAVHKETSWQAGLWDPEWKIRPEWGPCPIDNVRFEELHFSPDGRYARTLGGWQGAPLAGAWGYCLFEKKGRSWDLLRCAITAVS